MNEQVAKKKRVRKTSNAMLTIRIERVDTCIVSRQKWQPNVNADGTSGYVMDTGPQEIRVTILEQSLPEAKFDLAKVIKAINGL